MNSCKHNLGKIQWSVNGYQPPLPFKNCTFDLIYAISVFTHLDEKLQHDWLSELQRIAKPGAIVMLSVHGESFIKLLDLASQEEARSHGFIYITGTKGLLKLDGLPDFYQSSYHTQKYINREWSAYFNISNYIQQGIGSNQDVVLLRKT